MKILTLIALILASANFTNAESAKLKNPYSLNIERERPAPAPLKSAPISEKMLKHASDDDGSMPPISDEEPKSKGFWSKFGDAITAVCTGVF